MSSGNETSKKKARLLENQRRALELRRSGASYTEIAAAIGLSRSHAHRLVSLALADARESVATNADELRAEELSRLDALLSSLWAAARRGQLGAVDRVLKIMERRARMLNLDVQPAARGSAAGVFAGAIGVPADFDVAAFFETVFLAPARED